MHTRESLIDDLRRMGLTPKDTVLAHTSMKAIGDVDGRADAVLDAFMAAFPDGLFVMPTLTWTAADDNPPIYDALRRKTDVGLLPEMFRKRQGVIRGLHPTHSVAAYGRGAEALVSGDHLAKTPCGHHSAWRKLLDADATILMIGCDLTSMTFLHGVEEWVNVPGRLAAPIEFTVITPSGERYKHTSAPHLGSPSEQFYLIEPALRSAGALVEGKFGDAKVLKLSAQKTMDTAAELLMKNPRLFDD